MPSRAAATVVTLAAAAAGAGAICLPKATLLTILAILKIGPSIQALQVVQALAAGVILLVAVILVAVLAVAVARTTVVAITVACRQSESAPS